MNPVEYTELTEIMADASPFDDLESLSAEELRQRLHALQALIARVPVPIAIAHDPRCQFISANRALATLLGLDVDANISLTPPPGEQPPYRIQRHGVDIPNDELPMQFAITHRSFISNEIEILRADGTVVYVQNDVEPLYDRNGEIYGCVSVCVDLTERKRTESEMRDTARRKDEFLATLSHELRNPLAPIRSAVEVMRLGLDDRAIVEKARAIIERQLAQLVRITDDLLDVSRITQDKLELRRQRIDMRDVLQSAIEAVRPAIDAKEHALAVDLPPAPLWVDGDPTRLVQVFSNLLHNAAKYTPASGHIQVAAAEDAGEIAVRITDTGVGIPPEMLPRIFDMFRQLQVFRDRTHGGLGIGLTLARRLLELHGATIESHSAGPGQGSTFIVRIPVAAAEAVVEAAAPSSGPPRGSCRVLIAEDSADAAEMMRMMLQMKGHDVRVAADGEQAIAVAEEFEPEIAILDIDMPRVDGREAARRIRRALGRRVVLVAVTGWGQEEDRRRSREAGFDHHLTKPPEPDVLDGLIAECVAEVTTNRRVGPRRATQVAPR